MPTTEFMPMTILAHKPAILAFIEANSSLLATKD